MDRTIDLNSDLGEGVGDDEAMMELVTSVNVACGGHAGDPSTMVATAEAATSAGLGIGAHPGFADREHFGRRVLPLSTAEIEHLVATQVGAMCGAAALAGARVTHVKAHGALANLATAEADVADAIARAVRAVDDELVLLTIAATEQEHAARRAGLRLAREAFADRAYLPDARLVPRDTDGAVITDPDEAAHRAVSMAAGEGLPLLEGGRHETPVDSVCVHGDTPSAVAMARQVRERLVEEGFTLRPMHLTVP